MTTHYILADDYVRWNPGEPIEDVASDLDYLALHPYLDYVTAVNNFYYGVPVTFADWLQSEITSGAIIRIETDENGKILA